MIRFMHNHRDRVRPLDETQEVRPATSPETGVRRLVLHAIAAEPLLRGRRGWEHSFRVTLYAPAIYSNSTFLWQRPHTSRSGRALRLHFLDARVVLSVSKI